MQKLRFGLSLLVVALALLPACRADAGADRRPNVLIIIADDLNGYGFYGDYPGVQVPAMEQFRASSVVFQHAYAAAPVGGPSRAAFFSGLYPHTTGAYLSGADPWNKTLAEIESLPELFRRSGYTTFGAGRLLGSKPPENRENGPWDNTVVHGSNGPLLSEEDLVLAPGEQRNPGAGRFWGVREWAGPDEDFPDVSNANRVIEYLQGEHEKPFFLVYGLWRPHNPYTAPVRFFDLYDADGLEDPPGYKEGDLYDVPPGGRRLSDVRSSRWLSSGKAYRENWRRILHGYLAATSFADWNVGRVLEALEGSGHADDTIVVFWSDNGYHLGEKNHFGKATLWEIAARTPLAVHIPGNPNNGRLVTRPVVAIDLFSTLQDYCLLEPPEHEVEGLSLRPLLENPAAKWSRPAITTYGENYVSIRNERYRYIRYPDGQEELYDHSKDPWEFVNLAENPNYKYVKLQFKKWIPEHFAPNLGGRNG